PGTPACTPSVSVPRTISHPCGARGTIRSAAPPTVTIKPSASGSTVPATSQRRSAPERTSWSIGPILWLDIWEERRNYESIPDIADVDSGASACKNPEEGGGP